MKFKLSLIALFVASQFLPQQAVILHQSALQKHGHVAELSVARSADLSARRSTDLSTTERAIDRSTDQSTAQPQRSKSYQDLDFLDFSSLAILEVQALTKAWLYLSSYLSSLLAQGIKLLELVSPAGAKANSLGVCPNSHILSHKLISDICWDCMFPIKIAGASLTGNDDIPKGAVKDAVCSCKRKADLPRFGYTLGFWQPIRLVELVRTPGCMMALNGTRSKVGRTQQIGGQGEASELGTAFYHYHFYAFPLLQILGLLNKDLCFSNEFSSIDVLYISEIDPSWNYPEISQLVFPETRVFANQASILACGAEAIASLGSKASLPWCAGTWGTLYPISGYDVSLGSTARITSLLATRALAASHRRGFEVQTIGKQAMCGVRTAFEFIPDQYRFSMLYPMPQDSKHPIGRSTFTWGEASGADDAIYMVWRWRDCCSSLFIGR
ncbi:hypothetical protein CKF54_02415 [Psittacicella hinzii]|uniref:TraU protein n=1 Tax=Psittacicella hinzii TaxID=2028575 RepID=A0A3A1Y8N7_9GAMM|nr:TraU family protein [Psittacicella hinzii]RIY33676.1 hypothetical protein CKF54_02415 [Psittacicella hinzii]